MTGSTRRTIEFGSAGISSISVNVIKRIVDLDQDEPIVISGTIGDSGIHGSAMIDSRASTQFLNLDFTIKHNIPLNLKTKPDTLIVVDGQEAASLTHTCCKWGLRIIALKSDRPAN